jgi:hypothetical protein
MKKLLFCLYALCFISNEPAELAANNAPEQCYYSEPSSLPIFEPCLFFAFNLKYEEACQGRQERLL